MTDWEELFHEHMEKQKYIHFQLVVIQILIWNFHFITFDQYDEYSSKKSSALTRKRIILKNDYCVKQMLFSSLGYWFTDVNGFYKFCFLLSWLLLFVINELMNRKWNKNSIFHFGIGLSLILKIPEINEEFVMKFYILKMFSFTKGLELRNIIFLLIVQIKLRH